MFRKIFSFSNATLLVALTLSTIAAWYSIIGLTAIFAGAVIPIIIMGSALELGKIVTTVWLRKYWTRCAWIMKLYLVPAVFFLAVLTSMGIFGFLSKAHMDQNIVSGDVQSKIAIYDMKINTAKENIDANRKILKQMDESVDQTMGRSSDEKGADKAVALRKSQAKERARLLADIQTEQKTIAQLNDEAAPIRAEVRKVEAEVGPIKYIAALIYGDNPDQNVLERAVRWVIIMLVAVFDPLALMLVIAANQSKEWDENIEEESKLKEEVEHEKVIAELESERPVLVEVQEPEEDLTDINHELAEAAVINETIIDEPEVIVEDTRTLAEKHPYLNQPFKHFENMTPMVAKTDEQEVEELVEQAAEETLKDVDTFEEGRAEAENNAILAFGVDVVDRPGDYLNTTDIPEIVEVHVKQEPVEDNGPSFEGVKVNGEWVQTGPVLEPKKKPIINGDYVEYDNKLMHKDVFAMQYPNLFLEEDGYTGSKTSFGTELPKKGRTGDFFVRVDVFPNQVYKYNGVRWIETNRENSNTYLTTAYLEFLISKLATGEYDPELLSDNEQEAIAEHIKHKKS